MGEFDFMRKQEEKAEEEVEEESHTEQPTNNFKASPDNVKELSVTGLPGSELGGPSNIEQYQTRPSNIEEGKDQYEDTPSLSSSDSSPVIDIDLTDPEVEAAATKIQTAFKGFKSRKQLP